MMVHHRFLTLSSDFQNIMFDVSVLSVKCAHMHCSYIIRMCMSFSQFMPDVMEIVRSPSNLSILNTYAFFQNCGRDGISHSHTLFFSVFASCSFVPVPWDHVCIKHMASIDDGDEKNPHGKGTVTVECIFLEISVHFIRNFDKKIFTVRSVAVTAIGFWVNTDHTRKIWTFNKEAIEHLLTNVIHFVLQNSSGNS